MFPSKISNSIILLLFIWSTAEYDRIISPLLFGCLVVLLPSFSMIFSFAQKKVHSSHKGAMNLISIDIHNTNTDKHIISALQEIVHDSVDKLKRCEADCYWKSDPFDIIGAVMYNRCNGAEMITSETCEPQGSEFPWAIRTGKDKIPPVFYSSYLVGWE